ncbi:type VI secretion system protein TssA [Litorisediminicola beolgyonensis]|uniref:Type VI secretion system protein TssA n=1 Tax=Litorisediminicola beolgyonensis TaxID=1173614 RepID=A0ABW3ZKJ3_9RHOB
MEIESLLAPIGEDQASGVELRNDARFHSIERLLEPAGRDVRLNSDGTINESAPPVDWSAVEAECLALAEEGRDLRLLTKLVRATYAADGFDGLAQGLELLRRSVAEFWDSIHPALRDRDDPKMVAMPRTNALRQLESDDNGLLGDLRFGALLQQRGLGTIFGDDFSMGTWSDFEVLNNAASGLNQSEKDAIVAEHAQRVNRVTAATRALAAEEPERAAAMMTGIGACIDGISALIATYGEVAGFGNEPGLSLPELTAFLTDCRKTLAAAVAASDDAAARSDTAAPSAAAPAGAAPAAAAAPAGGGGGNGTINSRKDVEDALDRIVAFYERTEPSSPIPHLARRVRRMVSMDFLELMEEVAPSGLKEFRSVAGVEEPKKR